jgi:hypothetical protein
MAAIITAEDPPFNAFSAYIFQLFGKHSCKPTDNSICRSATTRLNSPTTSGPIKSSLGGVLAEKLPNTRPHNVVVRNWRGPCSSSRNVPGIPH